MTRVTVLLFVYLISLNFITFVAMYCDKRKAKRKQWRIPERTLLFLGVSGGGLGGLVSQQLFTHKTKKIRFYFFFTVGIVIDLCILYYNYKSYR